MITPVARTVKTSEGTFVHVEDIGRAVKNTEWMDAKIVPLLKVGYDQGRPACEILAVIVASVVLECSGEMKKITS